MATHGLTALIGPLSPSAANHVQCLTSQLQVPHIETRFDYTNIRSPFSLNIHPHPAKLGKVSSKCHIIIIRPPDRQAASRLRSDENPLSYSFEPFTHLSFLLVQSGHGGPGRTRALGPLGFGPLGHLGLWALGLLGTSAFGYLGLWALGSLKDGIKFFE